MTTTCLSDGTLLHSSDGSPGQPCHATRERCRKAAAFPPRPARALASTHGLGPVTSRSLKSKLDPDIQVAQSAIKIVEQMERDADGGEEKPTLAKEEGVQVLDSGRSHRGVRPPRGQAARPGTRQAAGARQPAPISATLSRWLPLRFKSSGAFLLSRMRRDQGMARQLTSVQMTDTEGPALQMRPLQALSRRIRWPAWRRR